MKIHTIQQGSPEWFELRVGRITGTSAAKCLASKWLDFSDQLAGERLTGMADDQFDFYESEDMIRGKELEPIARQLYARQFNADIEVVGFIQPDDMPYFGMSPDGIYKDGTGAIEIKAPRIKNHLKYIRHDKIPTEYMAQIVSIFICSETIQFVDFISYCQDCADWKMWVKRMNRADVTELIKKYKDAITKTSIAADQLVERVKLGETW